MVGYCIACAQLPVTLRSLTEFLPPRILMLYAGLLHASPTGLLYSGLGVWVVQTGFLTPTRRGQGGFRFLWL